MLKTTVLLTVFLVWGIVLWRNWRKAKTQYPSVDYTPPELPESEAWRWATPPDDLELHTLQTEHLSWLHLRPIRSFNEIIFGLLGFALALATLYVGGVVLINLFREPGFGWGLMQVIIVAVMAGLSYLLCCVDSPVTTISRSPDTMTIHVRLAIFFQRTVTYKHKSAAHITFDGKLQNVLAMNTDQLDRLPDYNLTVKRRFRPGQRFLMRCNPSQATWIIGGLNSWCRYGR